jgi:hypothetical protein
VYFFNKIAVQISGYIIVSIKSMLKELILAMRLILAIFAIKALFLSIIVIGVKLVIKRIMLILRIVYIIVYKKEFCKYYYKK